MILISLASLALAIGFYSVSQLLQHEKFKWSGAGYAFWGGRTALRKYKFPLESYQGNWYYRFFKIKYKEAYLFSSNFLIWTTDGYHLCQALFLLFLSLSVAFAIGFSWWIFIIVYALTHAVHFVTYRLLQR